MVPLCLDGTALHYRPHPRPSHKLLLHKMIPGYGCRPHGLFLEAGRRCLHSDRSVVYMARVLWELWQSGQWTPTFLGFHVPSHPCGLSWALATLYHPAVPCLAPVGGK